MPVFGKVIVELFLLPHNSCQDLPRETMLINYNGGTMFRLPAEIDPRHAQPYPVRVDSSNATSIQLVKRLKTVGFVKKY
jgi:hypothetical protein